MDIEENLPLRQGEPIAKLIAQDLDPLSIKELDERIAILQSEILRCEAKKSAASSHMKAADALFKKG